MNFQKREFIHSIFSVKNILTVKRRLDRLLWRLIPSIGLLSLIWFLIRVIPKPSRATYPCMRLAFPLTSSFAGWLISLGGSVFLLRNAKKRLRESRYILAAIFVVVTITLTWYNLNGKPFRYFTEGLTPSLKAESLPDPVNDPIGEPKGYNPGRVVWIHDPEATDWGGADSGESCWEPQNTDQTVVENMLSLALRLLAGKSSDDAAWDALFRYTNIQKGVGDRGYQAGEKIFVKVNLTSCNAAWSADRPNRQRTEHLDKAGDTNPQIILALLRQLVNTVNVAQADISVGDTVSFFPDQWYNYLASEFPSVHYLDHYGYAGRTAVKKSTIPFYWSTTDAEGKLQDYLPVSISNADYIINIPVLKSHALGGITVCAKNLYGSLIRAPLGHEKGEVKNYFDLHQSLPCLQPGRGYYRALVDLMGHSEIGGKTVLYLIDALYAGQDWNGIPFKWIMAPFNGDWPSSLFASQDPVAIDSVAYDFLHTEWPDYVENGVCVSNDSLDGGAQDYLHEAALANNPASGSFYDPERDNVPMTSLGVHEHWNNPTDKQYSRNLGTGDGIELISPNNLPTAPEINSPQDGVEIDTLEPVLVVDNATDLDMNTLTYFFEIDKVKSFDSPSLERSAEIAEGSGETTSWEPSPLDDNTTYHWRARAYDVAAYGDWSVASFFVNLFNDPPTTPTLNSPASGGIVTSLYPVLSVNNASDVDKDSLSYRFELYSDPLLSNGVAIGVVPEGNIITSWTVPTMLTNNATYYWLVTASDEELYSNPMPIAVFHVNISGSPLEDDSGGSCFIITTAAYE